MRFDNGGDGADFDFDTDTYRPTPTPFFDNSNNFDFTLHIFPFWGTPLLLNFNKLRRFVAAVTKGGGGWIVGSRGEGRNHLGSVQSAMLLGRRRFI